MGKESARRRDRRPLALGAAEIATTAEGVAAAAHYGDPPGEDRALRQACGLVDRLWVEHLELRGEDRLRFLNGLVTGDVAALAPGRGLFAFFTNAQGRILSEARIAAHSERLVVELPAGRAAAIAEHLLRYKVADRVEIEPLPSLRALSLIGPRAAEVAGRLGPLPAAEPWACGRLEWEGLELLASREARLGAPAVTLRVDEEAMARLADALARPSDGLAAVPAGFRAAEVVRVEAGLCRYGPDFGEERFPQEVGAEEALDFEKGCYLGQEVVARIHYRGKVNHRPCGLRLAGDELPSAGGEVTLGGSAVGRSGTAVRSPRLGAVGLAILHRRAEAGARVAVAEREAEVVELPFA